MKEMIVKTLKNLFSPPVTVRYPEEESPIPSDYRGAIIYKKELCIFCTKCELVCPPGAIKFTYHGDEKRFHYNPYLCIYCGECVRACPRKGCLVQIPQTFQPATNEELPDWDAVESEAERTKREWLAAKKKKG